MRKKTGAAVSKADEIKSSAKALEETILSLLSTIKQLSKTLKGRTKSQRRLLSILRGPFFGKSTRRRLKDLHDLFYGLNENLKDAYDFYHNFSPLDKFQYPNPHDFAVCESLWKRWRADSHKATVLKKILLVKLSPGDDGELYNEFREGNWPTKEIDDLKKDTIALLAIVREFK